MTDHYSDIALVDRIYRFIVQRSAPIRFISGFGARLLLRILGRFRNFRISTDRSLTDLHMVLGTYEIGTQRLCRRILKPGSVAVDVGAHVGFFTRLFADCVGDSGSVVAFEPHPKTFRTLARNCENQENVVLIQAAAAECTRSAILYQSKQSSGSNSLVSSRAESVRRVPVPALALDDVFPDQVVDLVKIDVEGGEIEVLEGMRRLIERSNHLMLIVELFPPVWLSRGLAPDHLLTLFHQLGFTTYAISNSGDLSPIKLGATATFVEGVQKYVNVLAIKDPLTIQDALFEDSLRSRK